VELRPGFKHTEVGVIPVDWEVRQLGDFLEFRNGVNAEKQSYGHGVRFINVLEAITHSHIHGPEITGQVTLPESVTASYAVIRGDVLFNRTSETQEEVGLAATYLGSERVVFGGFVIRGRPTPGTLDPTYSGYALRAPCIRSQIIPMGQGAIRANIGQANLSLVVAPLPPLPEQRAIAAALSDIDALLEGLTRLITKKRDLKQAAMQQLLTGQTRLPGFQEAWEMTRLGDVSEMGSGGTPTSSVHSYYDGGIPWVSISDMTTGGRIIKHTDRNLSRAGFSNCAAQMYPVGTVLYAMYASLGECSIAGIPLCSSQAILGIRPLGTLNNEFLYYQLHALKPFVKTLGQQGTQANLNKGMVQDFRIPLPQMAEQREIAAVLSDMDSELSTLASRRDKTRALKLAMMQELLTGKTRLV
jgi:type I restriction enzyme S subunit